MSKTPAKDKILQAAQQLMKGKGYSATTVDEIIAIAGVAKGSFYHAFKSKEDLAVVALEDYLARGMALLGSGEYRHETDPVKRAFAFLDYMDENSQALWAHGCLLGTVALEVTQSAPAVARQIDKLFRQFEAATDSLLEPALQARGVTSVSARELSIFLLSVIEGSIIAARSHGKPEYLNSGIRQFRLYLEQLLASA